ncbi:hypothetical protein B0H67DRAFT_594777 [Lasiosphaeris hirsuta]|uniref:DUF2828 domain-containing protein n=1 Tax=Lasiosphaeris hirsuta TaxID=260670 RepID=A0AA39ZY19_9PEZI|nr:hypothetical protein B0H67DRAFT_594777 [Lasiosphaeris hirsuta]
MATESANTQPEGQNEQWFLKARCPVFLPKSDALSLSDDDFDAFLAETLKAKPDATTNVASNDDDDDDELLDAEIDSVPSTTAGIRARLEVLMATGSSDEPPSQTDADNDVEEGEVENSGAEAAHPFMAGLHKPDTSPPRDEDYAANKMYTENGDIAHRSTNEPLVDLFYELEEVVSGPRLRELLDAAWERDALMTLKVIFNARSIHLGKSSRTAFYRSAGWLAQYHPRTLVANLRWLSRPVIPKKVEKKDEDAHDLVIVEAETVADADFDVRNGVAHGYWKDLLNLVVLSVSHKLDALSNPRDILNSERTNDRRKWPTQKEAKEKREVVRTRRHDSAVDAFENNPVHRALHLAVARLFAEQLKSDLAALEGTDAKAKRTISLCGKWAPSTARFHDKHTLIVSSIAELLYPPHSIDNLPPDSDRDMYLRYAREAYRRDTAALRKHLEVVERDLSAKTLSNIKYDRVPSTAMRNYAPIFAEKDTGRFEAYLDAVAGGKSRISGATLLPSTLIHAVRTERSGRGDRGKKQKNAMIEARVAAMDAKVVDGQWKTLVQRIKDSGTLESSIAVCDVSGSMDSPTFPDGTCPMDSAIGLSLLLAEVTAPPFGGTFITFSEHPVVEKVDLSKTLREKYQAMQSSAWGMSTNFEAVFLDLILPMAVSNKLAPEDMVRRIFVFSDMQFNSAQGYGGSRWSTSYQRVQEGFKKAGYEVPEMVFWNLAGGRAGYQGGGGYDSDDAFAPKPATADEEGVALVSGYSQGMLKVFMDKGMFEEGEGEEEVVVAEKHGLDSEDEDLVEVEKQVKKSKQDPLGVVKQSISHKAYAMLKVVD